MKLFFNIFLFLKLITTVFANVLTSDEKIFFSKIFSSHIKTLKNLNKEKPPCLILFSAAPGMGKTTISKFLEEKLFAIKISSDAKVLSASFHILFYNSFCKYLIISNLPK